MATVSSVLSASTTMISSAQASDCNASPIASDSFFAMTVAETGGTAAHRILTTTKTRRHEEDVEALELYRRTGAYLEGHFRLSSGLHSPGYLQSALVLQRPADAASLGQAIAVSVKSVKPTVVLSPALG